MFEGKISLDALNLNTSEINTLIKYKEELLEHQRQKLEERKKEEDLKKKGMRVTRR